MGVLWSTCCHQVCCMPITTKFYIKYNYISTVLPDIDFLSFRFITSYDEANGKMTYLLTFLSSVSEINADLVVLSGLHLLESQTESIWTNKYQVRIQKETEIISSRFPLITLTTTFSCSFWKIILLFTGTCKWAYAVAKKSSSSSRVSKYGKCKLCDTTFVKGNIWEFHCTSQPNQFDSSSNLPNLASFAETIIMRGNNPILTWHLNISSFFFSTN